MDARNGQMDVESLGVTLASISKTDARNGQTDVRPFPKRTSKKAKQTQHTIDFRHPEFEFQPPNSLLLSLTLHRKHVKFHRHILVLLYKSYNIIMSRRFEHHTTPKKRPRKSFHRVCDMLADDRASSPASKRRRIERSATVQAEEIDVVNVADCPTIDSYTRSDATVQAEEIDVVNVADCPTIDSSTRSDATVQAEEIDVVNVADCPTIDSSTRSE
ncbi:uncharacterized protein [Amphiura filiformis]|uniref:uncharacterized protein isoform X2 n=1 Tax=Amphiura filiformis TaxID=82378 RepID=UPI003B20CF11